MSGVRAWPKNLGCGSMDGTAVNYRPFHFIVLYFLLTWIPLWTAVAARRTESPVLFGISFILAGSGAVGSALILVYATGDRSFITDFWDRAYNFRRIQPLWWPVILFGIPVSAMAGMAFSILTGGSSGWFALDENFLERPLVFVFWLLIFGPLPEELAWRGYGLDSLRSRFSGLVAGLVAGALWSLWHVPLVFMAGSYQNELLEDIAALASYFFAMLPETLLIMWVYYNNKRSTLAAILLHFSANFAGEALQLEQSAKIIQTLILTACAVTVVCVDRKTFGRA